jgi:hypothetical protein
MATAKEDGRPCMAGLRVSRDAAARGQSEPGKAQPGMGLLSADTKTQKLHFNCLPMLESSIESIARNSSLPLSLQLSLQLPLWTRRLANLPARPQSPVTARTLGDFYKYE